MKGILIIEKECEFDVVRRNRNAPKVIICLETKQIDLAGDIFDLHKLPVYYREILVMANFLVKKDSEV